MYIAIDQYGNHFPIKEHPRKELCERLGRQHAARMFRDRTDGTTYHVGYVIAGHWLEVFGLEGLTFARPA